MTGDNSFMKNLISSFCNLFIISVNLFALMIFFFGKIGNIFFSKTCTTAVFNVSSGYNLVPINSKLLINNIKSIFPGTFCWFSKNNFLSKILVFDKLSPTLKLIPEFLSNCIFIDSVYIGKFFEFVKELKITAASPILICSSKSSFFELFAFTI